MMLLKHVFIKYLPIFNIVFTLVWLNNLALTDSYFSVYVLIAFFSFYLIACRSGDKYKNDHNISIFVLSVLLSIVVLLANYPLFLTVRDPARVGSGTNLMINLINTCFSFIGGISVFHPICKCFYNYMSSAGEQHSFFKKYKFLSLVVFLLFAVVNFVHLFLVEYPGNLTEDTFTQISEMVSGNYSNFNTFWHTMMLKLVLSIGYSGFGNLNSAAALFSGVQIILMAFAFTYCLRTMDDYGVSNKFIGFTFLIFLLMPYHMALMVTIWKDVLFSCGCLLMVTAILRILKAFSKDTICDYIIFLLGSLLFVLSRTNGWLIYIVLFVCYLLFNHKNYKLLACMGIISIAGWFLLNPMLSFLNVASGDPVESYSIPIQQVSRVIAEGHDISDEDLLLLSRVIDVEEVPQLYVEWLSDPMKVEVRSKDYNFFISNIQLYRDLWLRLAIKHPWTYIKAWVEQTKGYWNGGYGYAMYSETVVDNIYGVEKTGGSNPIASLFHLYFGLSRHVVFFEPLHSIGLHVWVMILCFVFNVIRKREVWIISVPVLVLVIGLWFGTPVYACFRYVYPLFVCFPLILSTYLYSRE